MLRYFGIILALAFILVACSGGDSGDGDAPPAAGEPSGDASTTDPAQPAPVGSDRPTVNIASAWLPGTLDPRMDSYSLIRFGMVETLTRVNHDLSVEPWIASSVELIGNEGDTWEITLREDARFWNGDAVTAEEVVSSIERAWEEQPASQRFLSPETRFEIIDATTFRLTLPQPNSSLPNNLATPQLAIYKQSDGETIGTGPYRPASLRVDNELQLSPFDDYWGGTPLLAGITVRQVADGNTRALAVQAGDVDLISEAPPEAAEIASGDVAVTSISSTRVHHMLVNHDRAPFNDPAVRKAVNLAIDRAELNTVALGGLGAPSSSIASPAAEIPAPEPIEVDREQAASLLDEAGWISGDDGVRTRDGERLQFLLYSYPGRPELTPMAVSIQDQLRRIGFDVSVQEVDDINAELEDPDYQAAMYSINMLPTGDPLYALDVLAHSEGISNFAGYRNASFDELLAQIRETVDQDERDRLLLDAQQTLQDDDAIIFLVSAPRVLMYRADFLADPALHPSEMYFIGVELPRPAE